MNILSDISNNRWEFALNCLYFSTSKVKFFIYFFKKALNIFSLFVHHYCDARFKLLLKFINLFADTSVVVKDFRPLISIAGFNLLAFLQKSINFLDKCIRSTHKFAVRIVQIDLAEATGDSESATGRSVHHSLQSLDFKSLACQQNRTFFTII